MPSASTSRSNSYMSTISTSIPSAGITTAHCLHQRTTFGPSSVGISPTSCNSPYTDPMSIDPGLRTSMSCQASMHSLTTPGASTINLIKEYKSGSNNGHASFVCDCCSKKNQFKTLEKPMYVDPITISSS
jgi:hypothetical protein